MLRLILLLLLLLLIYFNLQGFPFPRSLISMLPMAGVDANLLYSTLVLPAFHGHAPIQSTRLLTSIQDLPKRSAGITYLCMYI